MQIGFMILQLYSTTTLHEIFGTLKDTDLFFSGPTNEGEKVKGDFTKL